MSRNGCFMVHHLKVAVVYVHVPLDPHHQGLARRFSIYFRQNPPLYPHELIVVCNGSPPTPETLQTFEGLDARFVDHDDSGWDIGAYQKAASVCQSELMVFLGGTAYPSRTGWLARMVDAYLKHGHALYGSTGNRGDGRVNVYPHIRTTGFWLPTALMNAYPIRVTQNSQRYEFEHGRTCLTEWIKTQGLKAWVVTWDGEYLWENWDLIPNGFHRGDQSGLLIRDRVTDPPFYHV